MTDEPDPFAVRGGPPVLLPRPRTMRSIGDDVPDRAARERIDTSLHTQGYRLRIDAAGIELTGADEPGLFYGRATLEQLRRSASPGLLPALEIDDYPDFGIRGVMIDVARGRVPTMDTLEALVERLASWKINHLELYMEATFAYRDHPEVCGDIVAMTADELRKLDRLCQEHHVELTANQNTLGHLERWLRHDRYRPLAATPDGWTSRGGDHEPATTLDPANPAALALARSLLEELASCLRSRRIHTGLDEPLDLNPAVWASLYDEPEGPDLPSDGGFRVPLPPDRLAQYLAFVDGLRGTPSLRGYELLMWGDVLAAHREALERLPPGVTVCEWGYESEHPFASRLAALVAAGVPAWVCPGTSSWSGLAGRPRTARANIINAARAGLEGGAEALMVTDWGNTGLAPATEAQFAVAAATAWCRAANADADRFRSALSLHGFGDRTGDFGAGLLALGEADADIEHGVPEVALLALAVREPEAIPRLAASGLHSDSIEPVRERIAAASNKAHGARLDGPDGEALIAEVAWASSSLDVLARDLQARLRAGGSVSDIPKTTRRALARDLEPLVEEHRHLRATRYRPGGDDDIAQAFTMLVASYDD